MCRECALGVGGCALLAAWRPRPKLRIAAALHLKWMQGLVQALVGANSIAIFFM